MIVAIHEAGWTVQGAQLGQEESRGYEEQACSLLLCAEGLVAQGPSPGRDLYPALLSIELGMARHPLCLPLTRDYFIICPVIDMASHWARTVRGNVFMYHAPESYSHSR